MALPFHLGWNRSSRIFRFVSFALLISVLIFKTRSTSLSLPLLALAGREEYEKPDKELSSSQPLMEHWGITFVIVDIQWRSSKLVFVSQIDSEPVWNPWWLTIHFDLAEEDRSKQTLQMFFAGSNRSRTRGSMRQMDPINDEIPELEAIENRLLLERDNVIDGYVKTFASRMISLTGFGRA